jgi:hypothetical protein
VYGRHNIKLVITAKPCTGHEPEPFISLHAITNTYCFKFCINCILVLPTKNFTENRSTKFCTVFFSFNYYYYYYRYSALGPVRAESRAQPGDWYGSGMLHPGQILMGSLPLLSPSFN